MAGEAFHDTRRRALRLAAQALRGGVALAAVMVLALAVIVSIPKLRGDAGAIALLGCAVLASAAVVRFGHVRRPASVLSVLLRWMSVLVVAGVVLSIVLLCAGRGFLGCVRDSYVRLAAGAIAAAVLLLLRAYDAGAPREGGPLPRWVENTVVAAGTLLLTVIALGAWNRSLRFWEGMAGFSSLVADDAVPRHDDIPRYVDRAVIVGHGVYGASRWSSNRWARLPYLPGEDPAEVSFERTTEQIPGRIGTTAGLELALIGTPARESVPVSVRISHPTISVPFGEVLSGTSLNLRATLGGSSLFVGWSFRYGWETVAGD
jgi:hypothetical protein